VLPILFDPHNADQFRSVLAAWLSGILTSGQEKSPGGDQDGPVSGHEKSSGMIQSLLCTMFCCSGRPLLSPAVHGITISEKSREVVRDFTHLIGAFSYTMIIHIGALDFRGKVSIGRNAFLPR
jgi:hypothetical protein